MRRRSFAVGVVTSGLVACGERVAGAPQTRGEPGAPFDPPASMESPGSAANAASGGTPADPRISPSALAERAEALRKRHEGRRFTVLVEAPFVVVGDEAPQRVAHRSEKTIRWAVDLLRKDYFPADPAKIVDIYLFDGDASYMGHAKEIFGETPDTPYGYYSPSHEALIMNIATGGGTLVHEIVHPFMASNFPACPSWFNEGLASLYEQCGEEDGHLVGYTNWRLPALQAAIRSERVPAFSALCATTSRGFYDEDPGTNYAQARYLCHYLQSRALLHEYFRAFVAARDDPSGYATLARLVGDQGEMRGFERAWRRYVLDLRWS